MADDLQRVEELASDLLDDPFERRELVEAVRAFAEGTVDHEQRATIAAHAEALLETGDRAVIVMLASIGYEPALALVLFGGG